MILEVGGGSRVGYVAMGVLDFNGKVRDLVDEKVE